MACGPAHNAGDTRNHTDAGPWRSRNCGVLQSDSTAVVQQRAQCCCAVAIARNCGVHVAKATSCE